VKRSTELKPSIAWPSVFIVQTLAMTDVHKMWMPSFLQVSWFAAASILLVLMSSLIYGMKDVRMEPIAMQGRKWQLISYWVIGVLCVRYWHVRHIIDMRSLMIDSKWADMLPLLKAGFADLDRFESPFRTHEVPWKLTNYYLPSTFLPYYIFEKLGHDIRWINILSMDLIGALLLWYGTKIKSRVSFVPLAGAISLVIALNFFVDYYQLIRIIHLGPFWFYASLMGVGLALRKNCFIVVGGALALAARETAIFFLVPAFLAISWRQTLAILLGAGILVLPFACADLHFYAGNLNQYSSLGWILDMDEYRYRLVGLAAWLQTMKWDVWRFPLLTLISAATLLRMFQKRATHSSALVVWYGGVLSIVHALLALASWNYLYFEGIMLLGIAAINSTKTIGASNDVH
jgi:hypothetical protein